MRLRSTTGSDEGSFFRGFRMNTMAVHLCHRAASPLFPGSSRRLIAPADVSCWKRFPYSECVRLFAFGVTGLLEQSPRASSNGTDSMLRPQPDCVISMRVCEAKGLNCCAARAGQLPYVHGGGVNTLREVRGSSNKAHPEQQQRIPDAVVRLGCQLAN